jgi:integrase
VANVKLENVKADVDRHGNVRYYFRPPGYKPGLGIKLVRLPGLPFSTEFMDALAALKALPTAQPKIEPGASRTKPGSVNDAIAKYKASIKFIRTRETSKGQYLRMLDKLSIAFGNSLMSKFERKHMQALLNEEADTPSIASRLLSMMRNLTRIALDEGWIKVDPIAGMTVTLPKSDGILDWEPDEVAHYEANYPIGSMHRLAEALMVNMVARREDVIRMGPANIRNGNELRYKQIKTGEWVQIPLLPETRAALDAMPPNGHLVFLLNDNGLPFKDAGFGKWFSKSCRRIGLNRAAENGKYQLSAHGLRKAGCVALAEAGCSDHEIMACSGHLTLKEVQRYTKGVRRKVLARSAMAKLQAHRAAQAQAPQDADAEGA